MAKAPSLRKARTRGTQRTRKLSTGKALWSWRNGKERFVRARRRTAGAKPYTMKVVRTVFNGGHEETYGNATRLVPTQQGYCWPTSFKVLRVLFLGAVGSALLPSKMACWARQFRYVGVGQQYLMSQGSPPRMKIARLFSGES